mgnify:CR=1 FL=1
MILTQPIRWLGSKVRMRSKILDIFKEIPHSLYVEPFGGSGAIFFGKEPEPSVYNDKNELLVNFMKTLRSEQGRRAITELAAVSPKSPVFYREFKEICKAFIKNEGLQELLTRANFADYPPETAVAFAFFYVQNLSFGGIFLGSYGAEYCRDVQAQVYAYRNRIDALSLYADKLRLTEIRNDDWRVIVENYDAQDRLFYFDPPYECKTSDDYKSGWTSDDTAELVETLLRLKASFVLSCYDGALYKPLEEICEKKTFRAVTTCSRTARDKRSECVYIKNNNKARLFS